MKMTSVAIAAFCAVAIAGPALTTSAFALPLSAGLQHSSITIDPMINQVQFKGKGGFGKGGGGFNGGGRRFNGGGGRGFNRGAGVAVGLGVLGLAAAAAAANSGPVYRDCYMQRQPITDRWGNYIGTRPVRVCN